jgi:integrase
MTNQNATDATWSLNKDVHEPPRSPYWFACYRDSDGRRVRRSTKTTDKLLAQEIAQRWAQLAQAGRAGRLTESQCRAVIAEMYERSVGEPLHFRTARVYLLEWLESTRSNTTPGTFQRYEQTVRSFLTHVGIKADRLLREITPADVRSWRDALKAKGLSAVTCNGAIQVLRMPFRQAHDSGIIDLNPLTKSSVRLLRDEARNVEKDIFTPSMVSELLNAAPSEDWKGAIMAGYLTGLRLRDVVDLTWSNVDLDKRVIRVATRKTRKTVTVPIHPQFREWLVRQQRGIGKAPLFSTLHGRPGPGGSGLSSTFKKIMDRAGVRGRLLRVSEGKGRSHSSLSFHSLRHSFNSELMRAGIGVETRQELSGHSSMEMNRRYVHASIEGLRAAIESLPAIPTKARAR